MSLTATKGSAGGLSFYNPLSMKRIILFAALVATSLLVVAAPPEKAAVGVQAGIGMSMPTSSLADNFGSCVTFGGGLTVGYGPVQLAATVAYGQPSAKRSNIFDVHDAAGHDAQINGTGKPSLLRTELELSVAVCRIGRLTVRPAVGAAMHRYSWDVNDITWDTDAEGHDFFVVAQTNDRHLCSWGWLAGVHFDVRLHERYRSDLLPDRDARMSSVLRITPQVASARYNSTVPSASGVFVGFSVSYLGLLSAL